jgi:hypothetical protein
MKSESAEEALEAGQFFPTEEDVINFLKNVESSFRELVTGKKQDEFEYVVLTLEIREGQTVSFKDEND